VGLPPPAPTPPPELPPDLVARVRAGDVAAFEALFRATHAPLRAFARRLLDGDDAGAEELVQELFADLWTGRAGWAVRGSVRGYLFGAARNRALNARRHARVERAFEARETAAAAHGDPAAPPPADDALAEALDAAALRARVDGAIAALPERCRLAMQLRWRAQLRHAEIAEALGITVKGVERLLTRGIEALRQRIGERDAGA
jgi:RNA polymerase sigma-70 factor (ECF subfamily)